MEIEAERVIDWSSITACDSITGSFNGIDYQLEVETVEKTVWLTYRGADYFSFSFCQGELTSFEMNLDEGIDLATTFKNLSLGPFSFYERHFWTLTFVESLLYLLRIKTAHFVDTSRINGKIPYLLYAMIVGEKDLWTLLDLSYSDPELIRRAKQELLHFPVSRLNSSFPKEWTVFHLLHSCRYNFDAFLYWVEELEKEFPREIKILSHIAYRGTIVS